jgi:hypothetical protein
MRLHCNRRAAIALTLGAAIAGGATCGAGRDTDEGDRLAREHRWTEAVAAYRRALQRYPHDYDAAWGIARIYCFDTQHEAKCLTWTERLLATYPDEPSYRRARAAGLRLRADRARGRGDEAAARADETDADRLDPRR